MSRERIFREQLEEEDFKREERVRELKEANKEIVNCYDFIHDWRFRHLKTKKALNKLEDSLAEIEENILEVLNKYN